MEFIDMNNIKISDFSYQEKLTKIITIENEHLKVILSSYGAGIYQISYKKDQKWIETLLTPLHYEDYLKSKSYYGKTIGRAAGRVFSKPYEIDHQTWTVTPDEGQNSMLHGGAEGLSFQNFDVEEISNQSEKTRVIFKNISNDEVHGIPGTLTLYVHYILSGESLMMEYHAASDADTICNLTNHAYFNLEENKDSILNHEMQINSEHYIDVDDHFGYAGEKNVENTAFEFRVLHPIKNFFDQVKDTAYKGYDHVWQVNQHHHATLISKISGIGLHVYSDTPSIVVYMHNFKSPYLLNDHARSGIHQAITFECQKEAGCLFYKGRASLILKKGEQYTHKITYTYFSR